MDLETKLCSECQQPVGEAFKERLENVIRRIKPLIELLPSTEIEFLSESFPEDLGYSLKSFFAQLDILVHYYFGGSANDDINDFTLKSELLKWEELDKFWNNTEPTLTDKETTAKI